MALKIRMTIGAAAGLILLGLLGQARAGENVFCCVCDLCNGAARCTMDIDPADCGSFCSGINATTCGYEVSSSPCAALPACDLAVRAPALGARGLTALALLLTGAGALGARRAARRKRG